MANKNDVIAQCPYGHEWAARLTSIEDWVMPVPVDCPECQQIYHSHRPKDIRGNFYE